MIHRTAGPPACRMGSQSQRGFLSCILRHKSSAEADFYVGGLWERYFIDTRYVGNLSIPYLCADYEPLASVEKGGDCMVSAGRCYGLFTQ